MIMMLCDCEVRAKMYELTALAIGKKVPSRDYLYRPIYSDENFGLSHILEHGRQVLRFYGRICKGRRRDFERQVFIRRGNKLLGAAFPS
jgi:hypothetical protein